ncbi:hypothetical protein ACVI1N_003805 [Sinorhizobium medicae]
MPGAGHVENHPPASGPAWSDRSSTSTYRLQTRCAHGASMIHAALLSAFEASNSPLWCPRPDFFGRFVPESTSVLDVFSRRSVSISN